MKKENVVLTIGTFDGMHLGHKKVIDRLIQVSDQKGLRSVVVTFDNIPKDVIFGTNTNRIISNEKKHKILYNMGVDIVKSTRFTKNIQSMSQAEFIDSLGYNIDTLIVGHDFHFGKDQMDIDVDGIEVIRVKPFVHGSSVVSSSLIRKCLNNGNIYEANNYLGRIYEIDKKVVHGLKVGRTLGYPTFNIESDEHIDLLKKGVYVSKVKVDGETYSSITNVGNSPTFGIRETSVETFIFDFNEDIYGNDVKLSLLSFIREEKKFDSSEDLIEQIGNDIEIAKTLYLKGRV